MSARADNTTDEKVVNPRLKVMTNFHCYNNFSKFYKGLASYAAESEDAIRAKAILTRKLDKVEANLMGIYNCNPDWPICLYDFTFKGRDPSMFVFKVKSRLTDYVIPNYFASWEVMTVEETKEN